MLFIINIREPVHAATWFASNCLLLVSVFAWYQPVTSQALQASQVPAPVVLAGLCIEVHQKSVMPRTAERWNVALAYCTSRISREFDAYCESVRTTWHFVWFNVETCESRVVSTGPHSKWKCGPKSTGHLVAPCDWPLMYSESRNGFEIENRIK